MALEPCQILDVEAPRLALQFLGGKISDAKIVKLVKAKTRDVDLLLVSSGEVIEHPEQGFYIQLCEYSRCLQQVMRLLRIVGCRLEWIARHVILGPGEIGSVQKKTNNQSGLEYILLSVLRLRDT